MDSTPTRQPYFIEEEDDTQASLSDMEAGFSGNHLFFSRSHSAPHRRGSLRNLSFFSASSPRSARFYDARFEDHQPHFLEACFLCNKPLGDNRDIYMYRGDTPFCSEECRQEQIEMDEATEKNRSISSIKAFRKEQKTSSTPSKSQNYPFRTGTVAAA
ncbi:hypothetical protein VitviT2T_002350 [Vitis vinifera]|uniref:FLZ-type domain-containing protein n=2 Tax=Vitis vinifera TaxID=29760 RepID=F6HTE2_VITVI|nr:FCS-Like Zinc finger 2 [Vitis vinifera]WJZ82606.1 hypothetical protein VitviT2T_002350 [Vitis vinifera]|eukprot:XP_002282724.1 PREDICTED: uncharacterized protein LOC100257499 [Vitis vinifera]